jgi:predicted Zn-dependent protease
MGFDPNQQGRPRSGIGGRIILGLVIALIGWFMYMHQVQENPVTGEKQHVSLSPDQEIKLGLESAPEMSREMGGEVPSDDPRAKLVQAMGQKIVQGTVAARSPWEFKFHLLADTNTVNAFALPGGQVFITLGLLNKLQTEAQLAGVLSHEVGHVLERHSAQQMAKNQLGQWLIVAVGSAAASDSYQQGNYSAAMIAAVVNQMVQLRYSRKDELEADQWGLKLMHTLGYQPRAMIEVMEILKGVSRGGQQLEIFQTHPDPDNRIEHIKAYLQEHPEADQGTEGARLQDLLK